MPTQFALRSLNRQVWAFVCSLVSSLGIAIRFLSVQKAVGFNYITDIGSGSTYGVHPTRICIHAYVRLHAEVPLVAFLGLMHLWITRCGAVLGGAGHSSSFFAHQQVRDDLQNWPGQFVRLQSMTETHDGALIGSGTVPAQAGKVPEQRHVVHRLFHGGIARLNHCCMK